MSVTEGDGRMGIYLNSRKPQNNFQETVNSVYFVDKTGLLEELIPIVGPGKRTGSENGLLAGQGNKYICITRPRRFGKTVAANMIAAYFGKGYDGHKIFDGLEIRACEQFEEHLNQHNVIYITFNEMPGGCRTYEQYISRIQKRLLADLTHAYPDACIDKKDALWDAFNNIYELEEEVKFIFVLDEWDFIFHRSFVTDQDKKEYIAFLSSLLKDQPFYFTMSRKMWTM